MKTLRFLFLLFISITTFSGSLQAIKIDGKIRVVQPSSIRIETIAGENIATIALNKTTILDKQIDIVSDLYRVWFGENSQYIYLDGHSDICIDGFVDNKNIENCQINFTGTMANDTFSILRNKLSGIGGISEFTKFIADNNVNTEMITALYYIYGKDNLLYHPAYDDSKMIFDALPSTKDNATHKYLVSEIDSLYKYRIGGTAPDFTCIDTSGNSVSLSDFRGKYIILDFWASWCGPCRKEIGHMKTFYPQFKDRTDLVFISVSLDDTKQAWNNGLKGTEIPWISLMAYNKDAGEGKKAGFKNSPLKEDYGFKSIPFIVVLDKNGNYIARGLRGEQIKELIETLK